MHFPVGGGKMTQRQEQGSFSVSEDLQENVHTSFRTLQSEKWILVMQDVLWVASIAFIVYMGDWNSNLIHVLWKDERISKGFPLIYDCIGAIDSTLVHVIIQPEKQIPYRGRKGECMQQVMAVCSFDMLFTYVVCGWEGTAHDQRILLDTISDERLKFPHAPPGKYYLVDAGYTNMRGFLSPFRNVRYWLPDFQGVAIPRTREEHFNRLHSSLRNVIERSFGVLKARFPILKRMAPYPFPVQRSIVVAAMAMHNFIRKEDMEDQLFSQFSKDDAQVERDVGESHGENAYIFDITDRIEMDAKRNSIADAIWRDASSRV